MNTGHFVEGGKMIELSAGHNAVPEIVRDETIAFDAIVHEYQARIARYILRLVNDPELALDLTQDTFVNAFRHIHALRSELALSAWLYRIATNLAIHARKANRRLHL